MSLEWPFVVLDAEALFIYVVFDLELRFFLRVALVVAVEDGVADEIAIFIRQRKQAPDPESQIDH